jgi:hypothetical protein
MVDFGEPVLDAFFVADPIEDVVERIFVTGMVGELMPLSVSTVWMV